MIFEEKIKEYRERIKNKDTLKFVDFLASLLDWIDILYENKSLAIEQKKDILPYMPEKLFERLDKISPTDLSNEEYDKLKETLNKESSSLINYIIDIGNIKMTDFDLLQFNLYQIFGKEELASMIEESRLYLEDIVFKRMDKETREQEEKKKEEEEWLRKVNALPEKEMHKLIIDSMFNFKPSARTHEERIEAIDNNKRRVLNQRKKFRKFETRLMDATVRARADAQSHVYKRIGNVRRHMDKVTNEFREKAKIFVSEEGPKKMVREARGRIIEGRVRVEKGEKRLRKELEGKGKEWKKNFRKETEKARDKILDRKRELDMEMAAKGKEWKESFGARTKRAQAGILDKRAELSKEHKERKIFIAERGKSEMDSARDMIFEGKFDFENDVERAKKRFSGKGEEIDKAREDFIEKREIAQESFTRRGVEVEEEIYGTLIHERKRFEKERDEARGKFQKRAAEISGHAETHISEKRDKFDSDKKQAQERFLARAGEIKAKPTQEMMHKRELFLYDTRFARHRIQENAKAFAEKAAAKREEFETRGTQLVARHKAHQKAHLINNLLRTIRGMH